jgi:hypothetical protein
MLAASAAIKVCAMMLDADDEVAEALAHWATEIALAAELRAAAGPALRLVRPGEGSLWRTFGERRPGEPGSRAPL